MESSSSTPEPLVSGLRTLLVVDDEDNNLKSLEKIFAKEGVRVLCASNAKRAVAMMRQYQVQVVLTDLMMPGPSGVDLLKTIKEIAPHTEVVLMTAFGTVETAVAAMRHGAYDFVEKPLKRATIVRTVINAFEHALLVAENRQLRANIKALTHREIVGQSQAWRSVLEVARQAAASAATVLILGESGTGKELIARFVHSNSPRAEFKFVAVNCSAIPESILEAELFGYEKGAFTGATSRRDGRFARAEGGTLFLDEIGDLSPAVQVKLLRVLQDGEYEPLGGRPKQADVRIVTATHRDLAEAVSSGRFRQDLFYRLNVIALHAPPLRERQDDIPLLADHFLGVYCDKNQRSRISLEKDTLQKLTSYSWPGNVRQLENVMERAAVLLKGHSVHLNDLPLEIAEADERPRDRLEFEVGTSLAKVEAALIRATLERVKGDKALAANLLGISARTIYRKLDEA